MFDNKRFFVFVMENNCGIFLYENMQNVKKKINIFYLIRN